MKIKEKIFETDQKRLRKAFGSFITGVTVVTVKNELGQPVGLTVNSFTSVSLSPPLLLVCLAKSLSSYDVFIQKKYFAVNILAQNQQDVANIFASSKDNRFAQTQWRNNVYDLPIITDSSAHFSCETTQVVEAGDHAILIGRVVDFESTDRVGLGYSLQGYFSLDMERGEGTSLDTISTFVGGIIEFDGRVLMVATASGFHPLHFPVKSNQTALSCLQESLKSEGLSVGIGSVYSTFRDKQDRQYIYYRCHTEKGFQVEREGFVDINNLSLLKFHLPAIQAMMQRYQFESKHNVFESH